MNDQREPAIQPHPQSQFWIDSDSTTIDANFDDSLLVVRLGMAFNSIVAQNRAIVSAIDASGPAAARDRVILMVAAAALTHETVVLINKHFRRVVELAAAGGAPADAIKKIELLTGGRHKASRLIVLLRNQIGFHWDPAVTADSLKEFKSHQRIVWVEGKSDSTGEMICRLSADVLMNALWPESRDPSLTKEQRAVEMHARSAAGFSALAEAMGDVSSFIHYVLVGFFYMVQPQTHNRRPKMDIVTVSRAFFGTLRKFSLLQNLRRLSWVNRSIQGFTEAYVVAFTCIAFVAVLAGGQSHLVVAVCVIAAIRLFDLVVTLVSVAILDKGAVKDPRRSVLLAMLNYIEIWLWFAAIFRGVGEGFCVTGALSPRTIIGSLYFSLVTLTTVGYGDIVPGGEGTAALVGGELILGIYSSCSYCSRAW